MSEGDRGPGWDKKAVNRIAKEHYGSLHGMFDAHGWDAGGRTISQVAPTFVVQSYGSVDAFLKAHENDLAQSALVDPFAAVESDPPNVWLTSFYGFDPENWGLLAFGSESDRAGFIRESKPGALVVVYATKSVSTDEAGMVLGVQQMSHQQGRSEEFMSPAAWQKKQGDPKNRDRWNFAVKCTRAWYVVPEKRPRIDDFADQTYSSTKARAIGRYCMQLTTDEAMKILDLDMYEIPVFGGREIAALSIAKGRDVLKPSRPGPVSQSGYQVTESEGPKHLYMLELTGGDIGVFLDRPASGDRIIKVGFSVSPQTRCDCFNKALPGRRFQWTVERSTDTEGNHPYPSSHHAKAGEQEMVRYLDKETTSLGGEFFLASRDLISKAWEKGKKAAEEYKK